MDRLSFSLEDVADKQTEESGTEPTVALYRHWGCQPTKSTATTPTAPRGSFKRRSASSTTTAAPPRGHGTKVQLIIRDDAGVPDAGKRLAQELIVKDKVSFLGAGITPTAMAMAPLATEAKVATVVMISGTSVVTERSPYYVRTSFTLGQQSGIIADWATQNGSKKAVAIISDWAPGAEASKVFDQHFTEGGGQVLDTLKVPLANPDFAPFLQRARDLQPDTLFVFVPAGQAGTFARQF